MNSSPLSNPSSLHLPPPALLLAQVRTERARRAAEAERHRLAADAEAIRNRCDTLAGFVREAWHVLEPGNPLVEGWALHAIMEHLEAVTYGDINRLLINVPPGMSKSMLTSVLWPAWEWGPCGLPSLRILGTSHAQTLAIRDSLKMRRLVSSEWYQSLWGSTVRLTSDQNAKLKFENQATGFREAAAAGSITGSRGDRVIIDDPHTVESAGSDAMRASTNNWFLEAIPTRLNDPSNSAIIVIMQRLHEDDVSGVILEKELGYDHLMLPMEFERDRRCSTSIGFTDPREDDGELLFPERFPAEVVERDKVPMGTFAVAGQFQQRPEPRGGGIIKRQHWRLWDEEEGALHGVAGGKFPPFEYVVASVDTAYTEKEENDPSAMTLWGVWTDKDGNRRLMLSAAWSERLELSALVGEIAKTCKRFKPDRVLIEAKATGISVAQEIRRLHARENWAVQLVDPGRGDKVARAYAAQPLFEAGLVYAPDRTWAEMVIAQAASFPKGKHDDLVDTVTMAMAHLRVVGMAEMPSERLGVIEDQMRDWKRPPALYEV